ncbi:MAG TPA: AsmA-like C-terminal region-containing protein, partial [Chthoniobacterales bacterium]|nr:AsmA-like C-terminal region-containing protein [Chthoniobacterales bacterium]
VVEQPQIQTERPKRRSRHPALRATLRIAVILIIAGAISGGWYLARKGFRGQWRSRVVEELHRRGVEASIGHLTLDPFRGLVAKDVRIFSYKNRSETLAFITEIALDINYAAFFHHQPFLNAIDIRNAELTLPIKTPGSPPMKTPGSGKKIERPQLRKFHAHIYFPPEQIHISQAEGIFCGIRISATGQLIKREDYQPSPPLSDEEREKRWSLLRHTVAELQKFNFPNGPPSLQVKFSGDLANLEDAHAEATLQGALLKRKNYEMRDFIVAAEWNDQTLNVTRCEWNDRLGGLAATANWSRRTNQANFEVKSSLDLKTLLDAADLPEPLADVTFDVPPVIDVSGSANFTGSKPQVKLIGHFAAEKLAYKKLPLSDCRAEFSWDGERTWLRDIHVRHQNGELRAEVFEAPDEFRLNVNGPVAVGALRPFVSPEIQEFLGEWEFSREPVIQLAIRGKDRKPENWQGDGTVSLDRTRFRGQWMKSASSKIHFANGAVTYEDFHVTRDEGVGTGTFVYDFANHEVRVSNVKTNLRPAEVAWWIDPDLPKTVTPYKFHQPPTITANGIYQFRGGKGTKLEINVDGPAGMDYVFLGKTLPFHKINARLLFTNDHLQIVDLRGGLFSGSVRGSADISLAHTDEHYRAKLAIDAMDFPRLTDLYWGYKTAHGQLSGSYDFSGVGGNARLMEGRGKVAVANGDVFAIPVFGPLSGLLGSVIPGIGYSIARTATASFTIKAGTIHTDDLEVAGRLFSMLGQGDIHFLDDKLDFDVRVDPKGPGILLTPVYKLFEYKGEGSLKNPDWHLKQF